MLKLLLGVLVSHTFTSVQSACCIRYRKLARVFCLSRRTGELNIRKCLPKLAGELGAPMSTPPKRRSRLEYQIDQCCRAFLTPSSYSPTTSYPPNHGLNSLPNPHSRPSSWPAQKRLCYLSSRPQGHARLEEAIQQRR